MSTGDLLIGGVSRECQVGTLSILENVNGRSTLEAVVQSSDGSYSPVLDDVVEFLVDAETGTRFGGVVSEAPQSAWGNDGLITRISAVDYSSLPERVLLNVTTSGGFTGRDAIDYLIAQKLGAMGVTRDPAMPAGGTLGALTYEWATYAEVLTDIVRLVAPDGWLWRIDEGLVLRAWQPSLGTNPCPWSLTSVLQVDGGVEVTPSREKYANRIYVEYNDGTSTLAVETAEDAGEITAYGLFEKAYKVPGPITSTVAAALAASYLQAHLQRTHTIKFSTQVPGARAGQTLTVNLSAYGLSADYLITALEIRDPDGVDLTYTITAVPGTSVVPDFKDTYREWSGGGSTGGGALAGASTVVITTTTPAPSVTPLGGASHQALVPGASTWAAVVNAVPFVAPESRSVTVRVELWARSSGVTVTARLRDRTAGTTAGTSSGVTGSTPTLVSFSAAVVAGNRYELQLTADANDEGVFGVGSMEFL